MEHKGATTVSNVVETITSAQARAAEIKPKVGGFPYLAEVLRQAGVSRCYFTVPSMTALYVTSDGNAIQQGKPILTDMVEVPGFNQPNLVAAIAVDKAGDCTYPEFIEAIWRAGVTGYEIDFAARSCTYFGVAGDRYLESYEQVEIPPAPLASPAVATGIHRPLD
jgi:uncharacterized protein YbcV (DUF1398 family)